MNAKQIQTSSEKELRNFGLIMAVFIAFIFGIFLPWLTKWQTGYVPWILSSIFIVVAVLIPSILAPVFRFWMALGAVLGRVNAFIILLLVWIVLFIPIGMILKLFRYDPLCSQTKKCSQTKNNLKSYRIVRESALGKTSLENPF